MFAKTVLLTLISIPPVMAGNEAPLKRGGMALAVEVGYGGDRLASVTGTELRAGEGITPMVGGFYPPPADSPLEIYGLAGYDLGFIVPVEGGGGYQTELQSPVLELLANYRFDNKW